MSDAGQGENAAAGDATEECLELDAVSGDASLEQLILADATLLGRKTYEALAALWPHLGEIRRWAGPRRAEYVASRTLAGRLEWNATLVERRPGAVVWYCLHVASATRPTE